MGYALSIDELKQKFGDVTLEIISHKENIRTSCVRRASDNAVVAYSIVIFHSEGIAAFGDELHNQILSGRPVGETIKNSGIPHERTVSEPTSSKVNLELSFLFNTKKDTCVSRMVSYKISNFPYASITEFYNPEFTPVGNNLMESKEGKLQEGIL